MTRAAAPLARFIQRTIITVEDLLMLGDNRDVDMLGSPKCFMSLLSVESTISSVGGRSCRVTLRGLGETTSPGEVHPDWLGASVRRSHCAAWCPCS
jgi:hypothetical protein